MYVKHILFQQSPPFWWWQTLVFKMFIKLVKYSQASFGHLFKYSQALLFSLLTLSICLLNWDTVVDLAQFQTTPLNSLSFRFFVKFFHKCIAQYLCATPDITSWTTGISPCAKQNKNLKWIAVTRKHYVKTPL